MATTPEIIEAGTPRGIQRTLENFVIETESITPADRSEEVPDQKGAIADEINYDVRTNLRLTVRSAKATVSAPPAEAGSASFSYDGKLWKVDDVEESGTYNGLRRWNINAHRYVNYPKQPAQQPAQAGQS